MTNNTNNTKLILLLYLTFPEKVIKAQEQPNSYIKDTKACEPPFLMKLPLLLSSILLICSPPLTAGDDHLLGLPNGVSLKQVLSSLQELHRMMKEISQASKYKGSNYFMWRL